uniref:Uncharacterized protein n=1 Tax=Heterorhabditis bacteriophora TaxID=37862 RepID=A0A1I7WFN6_HETBA
MIKLALNNNIVNTKLNLKNRKIQKEPKNGENKIFSDLKFEMKFNNLVHP